MMHTIDWEVGWSDNEHEPPSRWVPAVVPGAVQLDWAKAEHWDDHTYGENWRQYGWMEDKYWTYRARLHHPTLSEGERLFFISRGIDYHFTIRLNGIELIRQEGMFTPVELDITDQIHKGTEIEIVIEPAPKRVDAPISRSQADNSCKPAVSYGWDWHPRLIPLGIWDDTYLVIRPNTHIIACEVFYDLNDTMDQVEVNLKASFNHVVSGELIWKLIAPNHETVFERSCDLSSNTCTLNFSIDQPELWWPHDHGEQSLYTSEVYIKSSLDSQPSAERYRQRIGFRKVRLVMHEGAWKEPSSFPKSRSNPPITLEINGRNIFCKGTNWVHPSIFPGTITTENYRVLLDLAKAANMNMLRIWGGGIVNKESFFEHCDEMGLMVWQEFPLACNLYPDSPAYLKVLDQESRSIITRLRKHTSVVLWCGGNELFNAWSRMTDQSLPLRLLNANCYELDPKTPFIMTSPLDGMGHGHYMFQYSPTEDVLQAMPKAQNTAYTEFGVPSPSSVEQLKSFIPLDELFPPKPGTSWESHHAFNALSENMWLMADQIEHYFGPYETLEQLVECGQLLQSEGYKCIYEEARRQKPRCSMALNWCYNEPWPTAANNSIVSWPAKPKPSYYAVQASCRPILASLRLPKFEWKADEWFEPELWLLNDSPNHVQTGRMEAYMTLGSGDRQLLLTWDYASLAPNENRRGPTARYLIPDLDSMRITLELIVADKPEWNSVYTVLLKGNDQRRRISSSNLNFN